MPNIRFRLSALTALLSIMVLVMLGCSPQATATPVTTATFEPTVTEVEFIPTVPRDSQETVIFSFEEDGYAHLFLYAPENLPLTHPARMEKGSHSPPTAAVSGICIFWIWKVGRLPNSQTHLNMKARPHGLQMAPSWPSKYIMMRI
jgi:hypothetical protein